MMFHLFQISAVSVQVPIRFRMDQPPPYRVRRESGNSDKVSVSGNFDSSSILIDLKEKRKSSLAVVPVSTKRRLPSLRLSSVTESHNELYQNTVSYRLSIEMRMGTVVAWKYRTRWSISLTSQ